MKTLIFIAVLAMLSYGTMIFLSEDFVLPSLSIVLAFCTISFIDYTIRAYRWKTLLAHYGMKVNFSEAIKTYISGFAFSLTPAKSGELMKAELMNSRHNFNRKKVGFIVLVERAFDIISHAIIGGIAAFFVAQNYLKNLWLTVTLILFSFGLLYIFRDKLKFIKNELERLKDWKLIVKSIILSLFAWLLEDIELLLAILYFGGSITSLQAFFAFSAGIILGNLTLLPGGLGATEASSLGLLLFFGIEKGIATSSIMLTRFSTLWFSFFLGVLFWFLNYKKQDKAF